MFSKILIANRGEIACRVIKTARRLGIKTVAVYSDADTGARHVAMADEAVHIGGSAARESYLVVDRILDAARRTGAQAIHPGYGFLSENAGFADACAKAGVVFIGPPPSAIRAMGSKSEAKKIMEKASTWVVNYTGTVRPTVTYIFVFELVAINAFMAYFLWTHPGMIQSMDDIIKYSDLIFSTDEMAMLGGIVGFWFGSRQWQKK